MNDLSAIHNNYDFVLTRCIRYVFLKCSVIAVGKFMIGGPPILFIPIILTLS